MFSPKPMPGSLVQPEAWDWALNAVIEIACSQLLAKRLLFFNKITSVLLANAMLITFVNQAKQAKTWPEEEPPSTKRKRSKP